MILGIDEVGRGSWAGPLVVGAVVLGGIEIEGLTDSKKLTKKRREELDVVIRQKAKGFGLGWVSAEEIDEIGLSAALKLATIRAVEQIKVPYHEIIIDGTVNFLAETNKGKYVQLMKKADLLIPSVSAASIVAKVARDNYMAKMSSEYRDYGFDKHVGYGTRIHSEALYKQGITPLHRKSFAPIKKLCTTKEIGNNAEDTATQYLEKQGYEIIARNWKNKFCEIDIIARNKDTLFFVEVKYRKDDRYGDGLAAINEKKIRQMRFAAKYYIETVSSNCSQTNLMAMSLCGEPAKVVDCLEVF